MRTTTLALLACCCLSLAPALAGEPTRYLDVVNRAHDSLTAMAVRPVDSDSFRDLPLAAPVRGGGDATTLAIRDSGCRFDLRMQFRDGRAVVYKDVDVCRLQSLRIDPLRKQDDGTRLAKD